MEKLAETNPRKCFLFLPQWEDEDNGDTPNLPDRAPEAGDFIFVRWDGDPEDYVCILEGEYPNLMIRSAEEKVRAQFVGCE